MVDIWGSLNERNSKPRLNVCTSLADTYNSSEDVTALQIEARCKRVRQAAVIGDQK